MTTTTNPPVAIARPFNLHTVRMLDGPFRDAMERDQRFLLHIEPDRLLHNVRVTAGLPSHAQPLGGWEAPESELRGHFLGHYLSACALMYAATGDARWKTRVDYLVAELAACQAALPAHGYHAGFLSAYPESFFDRVDRREPVWAPYYTLHKIMAGLLDAYGHCANEQARTVLEQLADWLAFRVGRLSHEQMQIALLNEPGGMNEVLANLYAITGNPAHLQLSLAFNDELVLDPLARGEDCLDRLHANTQIPKAVGIARQYELTGDARWRDIARFFWQRVALHRSYAIGGNSDDELFFPIDRFAEHLSPVTAETCNTYNMLKLTRHLFTWQPSVQLMDFYERALLNHILGSQDPDTGMLIYFASLKPGHVKIYNTPDTSFWCCTGTGLENHAAYGAAIYAHSDDALWVNLFIASEVQWADKGIALRQETAFPAHDSTVLTVACHQPTRFTLHLRVPGWAEGAGIAINGDAAGCEATPGSYATIERTWHDGDRVELRLPMRLQLEPLPGTEHIVAVLYGPVVLAGALGTENLPDLYLKDAYTRMTATNDWPTPPVPALVGTPDEVLASITPVTGKPLQFRMQQIELQPYYALHHQRYTVYWTLSG